MIAKLALLLLAGCATARANVVPATPAPKDVVTSTLLNALNANAESTAWKEAAAEKQWNLLTYNFDVANNLTQIVGLSTSKVQRCRDITRAALDKIHNEGTKNVAKCFFHAENAVKGEICSSNVLLPLYKRSFDEFLALVNCVR